MGRPKGSTNKPKSTKPVLDRITMTLSDEDLAPVRARQAAHDKAAKAFVREAVSREMRQRDAGEISDLSVPQVIPFDLSEEYHKAAMKKALAAGLAGIANLRKEGGAWVFDGLTAAGLRKVEQQRARDRDGAVAQALDRLEKRNEAFA